MFETQRLLHSSDIEAGFEQVVAKEGRRVRGVTCWWRSARSAACWMALRSSLVLRRRCRLIPLRGSIDKLGEGKIYCRGRSRQASGYLRASAVGRRRGPQEHQVQFDSQRAVKNVFVEEQDGAECLVLGWGGPSCSAPQVGEEGFEVAAVEVERVAFVVAEDVAADPVEVGLFGF